MNKKLLILGFSFFFIFSLMLLSQEQSKEKKKEVKFPYWLDEYYVVYVIPGEKSFHIETCDKLGTARTGMKLDYALKKDYKPCTSCINEGAENPLKSFFELRGLSKWRDERISITVDKVERADSFPERLRTPNITYRPPKKGHDIVLIHISIVERKDLKVHSTELHLERPNSHRLIDGRGEAHWADAAQFDITDRSTFFGKGGYLVFQMLKEATPVQLKFVYPYREKPPKPQKIKYGQIDIDLPRIQ